MLSKITVSPAPHVSAKLSTQRVMGDVLIGLLPAVIAAGIFFRLRALVVIAVCVAACVVSEWLCNKIRKRPSSIGDLSAVVTGVILALSLPPAVPFSAAIVGSAFAIVIAKMVFGGLGSNIFNPAMAARAFMVASFGAAMTTWTVPATVDGAMPDITAANTSATTQATPLAWSKAVQKGLVEAKYINEQTSWAFWGEVGGCLGETSGLAFLIGGAYLLIRRTIAWHIPAAVLLSAGAIALLTWLIKPDGFVNPLLHLMGGGMLICAFFIATDPVTAPLTTKGMWIFGVGVGALIMLIRIVGEYPEGVMYAVLIMNALSPLIDRFCKLTPAGGAPTLTKIKFFFQESWLLMVSSVVFGLLLAATDVAWKPRIERNVSDRFSVLAKGLLAGAERFESVAADPLTIEIGGKDVPVDVKRGLDGSGQTVGWAFVCEGSGFADKIRLVVAVDAAFEKMAGFGVLFSNETPGFGDKINITPDENGFFQPQFVGAPVAELTLTKTGDPATINDQIVAITGATVTSQAVVDTLNVWLLPIKEKLKAQGLLK